MFVYVKTRARVDAKWELLDGLVDAVEADVRVQRTTVMQEDDGISVGVTVEAASVAEAKLSAEEIVAQGLAQLGLQDDPRAIEVRDLDNNILG